MLAKAATGAPLRVIADIRMSPTYTWDAARAIERLIREETTGICHVTNAGACSWYEYARTILTLAGVQARLEATASREYHTKARRPPDSSLATTAAGAAVKEILRPWDQALEAYLLAREQAARGAGSR